MVSQFLNTDSNRIAVFKCGFFFHLTFLNADSNRIAFLDPDLRPDYRGEDLPNFII